MSISQMRDYISKHPKYGKSPYWVHRCMTMPEHQVIAIYHRFKKDDYRKIKKEIKNTEKENRNYHQINMFEYLDSIKKG